MTSSEAQRGYIASFIERTRHDYPTCATIWESIPKQNEEHPDTRGDWSRLILADKLKPLTSQQASYIIRAFKDERGYSLAKAFKMLVELKIVNL
jgi:hypothetical protein